MHEIYCVQRARLFRESVRMAKNVVVGLLLLLLLPSLLFKETMVAEYVTPCGDQHPYDNQPLPPAHGALGQTDPPPGCG